MSTVELRPATDADVEDICRIWHDGWRDGHLGNVPDGLLAHRRPDDFRALVPPRISLTTVAVHDGVVVGFVTVHRDEVEQVYVDAGARGSGVADALLANAESIVGQRFDRAWLAVVAGNARARRFYERRGWTNGGEFDTQAPMPGGGTIAVPALRYEKRVDGGTDE
jgi:ribosomal protein S18 acetylase RimI-like enzyme